MTNKINIDKKFSKFSEHWRPKIVAELNGQEFKLAKIKGEYPFHAHEGEAIVVPKGVVHRPRAEEECLIFLIEPKDVKNNGNAEVDAKYDAPMGEWV